MKPVLLLTRTWSKSKQFMTAVQLHRLEVDYVISPLTEIVMSLPVLPARKWSGIVFTSENAIIAASKMNVDRSLIAWCVGDHTAAVARSFGFTALSASSNSAVLASIMLKNKVTGPILYLHGEHSLDTIDTMLNASGIETVSMICYNQIAQALTHQAIELLQSNRTIIAPVFSPRSGRLLSQACSELDVVARLHIIAISNAAAAPFAKNTVTVSTQPNLEEMIKSTVLHLST